MNEERLSNCSEQKPKRSFKTIGCIVCVLAILAMSLVSVLLTVRQVQVVARKLFPQFQPSLKMLLILSTFLLLFRYLVSVSGRVSAWFLCGSAFDLLFVRSWAQLARAKFNSTERGGVCRPLVSF